MARKTAWLLPVAALATAIGLSLAGRRVEHDLATPRDLHGAAHATSAECRRCHPGQFDSWARTFHRTMTQEASEGAVLGDFEDARFRYGGIEARMRRTEGGGFEMRMFGPEGELSRAEVVRTVGSHRYQQYLARDGDVLFRLPLAWHVEEGRWFHMNGAFLTPDPPAPPPGGRIAREDFYRHVVRWNDNCVFCHNVAANPGLREDRFETEVAELGVACEACHGPAEEHARVNSDPVRRYALHLSERPDPTIVNPRRLDAARSNEVCGRCHGQRITDDVGRFLRAGDPYVPGDRLEEYSRPLARDTPLRGDATAFAARFWPDGTPRLTAYEYQGLLQSPCEGLTCTGCHGMHEGDPAGQLRVEARGDAQCTACHADDGHDGHRATACVDCHMPAIVYGLVGARRSHRIEVPDPQVERERPDACSLCHADRAPAWLARGYAHLWPGRAAGAPPPGGAPRLHDDVLGGDPVVRALAAEALGATAGLRDRPARLGLLLDVLAEDDYPAVRRIAWRSLRALAPSEAAIDWMTYRPTASRAERVGWIARARAEIGAGAVREPDPARARELRARAGDVAIDIGE